MNFFGTGDSATFQGPLLWCIEGDRAFTGLGAARNYEFASREYWRAANAGYAPAMSRLASCYELGQGVAQKSLGDALLWYRKAASLQDLDALDAMGRIYEAGTWPGVQQDFALAAAYYQQAAKRGHADALTNLGLLLERGLGVKQDLAKAIECFTKGADLGHGKAQDCLGTMYYSGKGVQQDHQLAVHWYRAASRNGCASAMNNLGICYEDGCGVRQELEEAKRLYKMASDLNNAQAKTNLGCLYVQEERHQEAAHLFRAAADLGSTDALINLAELYASGALGIRDNRAALAAYESAFLLGNDRAQGPIERLTELIARGGETAPRGFTKDKLVQTERSVSVLIDADRKKISMLTEKVDTTKADLDVTREELTALRDLLERTRRDKEALEKTIQKNKTVASIGHSYYQAPPATPQAPPPIRAAPPIAGRGDGDAAVGPDAMVRRSSMSYTAPSRSAGMGASSGRVSTIDALKSIGKLGGLFASAMGGNPNVKTKAMKEMETKHHREVARLERKATMLDTDVERYRVASLALSELVQKLWLRVLALEDQVRLFGTEPVELDKAPLTNILGVQASELARDDFAVFSRPNDVKPQAPNAPILEQHELERIAPRPAVLEPAFKRLNSITGKPNGM